MAGINKVYDILKANANGFTVVDRGGGNGSMTDTDENTAFNIATQKGTTGNTVKVNIPNVDGKYKNFLIYEEQAITVGGGNTTDVDHILDVSAAAKTGLTKQAIDRLRSIVALSGAKAMVGVTPDAIASGANDSNSKKAFFLNFETESDPKKL